MATTDQIDLVGIEVPLRFRVGEAIVIPVSVVQSSDGTTAVNVTGRTYDVQIGTVGGSSIATFTISSLDAVNGTFELALDTSSLSKGRYYWELWEDNRFVCGGPVEITERKFTFT